MFPGVCTSSPVNRPPSAAAGRDTPRREPLTVVAKNMVFHLACLRNARRYFAVKGHLIRAAAACGVYERAYMRLLPVLVRKGSDAVDAGANFGAYTHELARLVGSTGRVFAFEPVPDVADSLEWSCRGTAARVDVFRELLSDRAGANVDLTIPCLRGGVPEPALATTLHGQVAARLPWKTVRVQAHLLDDHLDLFTDLSFVKVDIEGQEAAFLGGASLAVSRFRPILQVETAGLVTEAARVLAWAEAVDYAMFALIGGRLRAWRPGRQTSLNTYMLPAERVGNLPRVLFDDAENRR